MEKTLVQRLKPWISTFSSEIMKKYSHGDEVIVGGEIRQIFKASDYCDDSPVSVYVTVDDALGATDLLFLENASFSVYDQEQHFQPGMIVIAKGLVWKDTKKHSPEDKVDSSVICYEINRLTDEE